ncbi:MAG: inorganic pyrophosphatase [Clostridia bacterium]|nr:inorganic pyrophosphatase [Clostridia bacterium]
MIGSIVTVKVDRPLGSRHPKHHNILYPINYGYIEGIISGDGEELDAYILGVDKPVEQFTGRVIAIIHRLNDVEDKLVVAPDGVSFDKEQIAKVTFFQEQYFEIRIET